MNRRFNSIPNPRSRGWVTLNARLEFRSGLYVYRAALDVSRVLSNVMLTCAPVENPCVHPTFPLTLLVTSQFEEPVINGLYSGVDSCAQLSCPEIVGSYCGIAGPDDDGSAPVTARSFCCWVINATSEKLVFTGAEGVELAVSVV